MATPFTAWPSLNILLNTNSEGQRDDADQRDNGPTLIDVLMLNGKVSDGIQPPLTFHLPLSLTAACLPFAAHCGLGDVPWTPFNCYSSPASGRFKYIVWCGKSNVTVCRARNDSPIKPSICLPSTRISAMSRSL